MQKLGIFIYSLGSGGAERVVATLLPILSLKFEVHLILMNDKISYEIPECQIHFLECSKPSENPILKFLKLPFLALKYKKLCRNLGIDTEFVFLNRPNYIALMARMFGNKTRLVINECTTPSVMYMKNNFNSLANKFLISLLYPRADLILPNSKGNLEDLVQNFSINPKKCEILYNAIDLENIEQKALEDIALKDKFILSVGRLDKGKNHALLIRAYARLKTDLKLVILGEGVLKDELLALIKELNLEEKVLLLGFDNNPYKYMAKCEFFAFASVFEGFSNVLIESLACSCAVVCTDHKSGARELFGDDEFGLLVEVDNENSMFQGLKTMLEDDKLRKAYKNKAKTRAKAFDKVKIARDALKYLLG
ncbi:TPA: N-acetylgalactosamine-N,N'-diacetylbacillosaminyl-diphospho-undecaprenol 4-alpha-N-acetylgalactosaminyltransferase [Campylobacter jejuni]|uniref:Glycosyl transferase n=1 Tax=Campylobacter jejuni TaxID=197 RepID=A0A431DGV8_CAMJU|nr:MULTISPECIES: N-acetylgalactosamine-N,N'-diacetylbacillosaminyl-diphospho-undecaprenol 4-alpha-N-acetylgalactosaminyltransferase [Campylobacter]EIB21894.1 general glycosylation pathway protein [Campylobacter jejuni subsp. jejuni LMG 23216]AXL34065.1 glycosyl transferase family 1 [Campylobacter jejuni]EAJ8916461.1 N-acetylgalactosamine-N,N'-diacetylbacillosaminyl-diphospho-undecaprenol 4-alpha-N-acetylgalactosaminyltransferase [Campylobacter jejuni]EAK0248954.1 N-acetylgalactosamine-N,N'-diac